MTGNPHLTRRWPFGRVTEGLPTIRTFPAHRATLISMRALMNFKEREGWSFHIV
jgi:hypothetical protein